MVIPGLLGFQKPAGGGPPAFDDVPDAANISVLYCSPLQALSSRIGLPLANIRRDTDNAQQDISDDGASTWKYDSAVHSSFVGAGNAYQTVVYDQKGGLDQLESVLAVDQPLMSSVGKPTYTQQQWAESDYNLMNGSNFTIIIIGENWVLDNNRVFTVGDRGGTGSEMIQLRTPLSGTRVTMSTLLDDGTPITPFFSSSEIYAGRAALHITYDSTVGYACYVDGLSRAVTNNITGPLRTEAGMRTSVMARADGGNGSSGTIDTVIIKDEKTDSAQDAADFYAWAQTRGLV